MNPNASGFSLEASFLTAACRFHLIVYDELYFEAAEYSSTKHREAGLGAVSGPMHAGLAVTQSLS